MKNTLNIIDMLHAQGCSCVLRKGETIRTYRRRGVIDLYELCVNEPDFLRGASLADKVIGKGAAAILARGNVGRVYADVMSAPARALLKQAGIPAECAAEVPFIVNRRGDGRCPLETACEGLDTPEEIWPVVEDFVRRTFYTDAQKG